MNGICPTNIKRENDTAKYSLRFFYDALVCRAHTTGRLLFLLQHVFGSRRVTGRSGGHSVPVAFLFYTCSNVYGYTLPAAHCGTYTFSSRPTGIGISRQQQRHNYCSGWRQVVTLKHEDMNVKRIFGTILTVLGIGGLIRSEEHTSELQSLMRISYAVFCLKKKHIPNPVSELRPLAIS